MTTVAHESTELTQCHLSLCKPELTHPNPVLSLIVFTAFLRGRTAHSETPARNPVEFHTRVWFRPHSYGFLLLAQRGLFLLTFALGFSFFLSQFNVPGKTKSEKVVVVSRGVGVAGRHTHRSFPHPRHRLTPASAVR